MHRSRFASLVGLVSLAALAACGSDSVTATQNDLTATAAAAVFSHLADSVTKASGDTSLINAYANIATAIRLAGRVSNVTITVDGSAKTFLASAQQTELTPTICASAISCVTGGATALRSMIAWQLDDPRKVVQLTSFSNSDAIGSYIAPTASVFASLPALLVYLDGSGGAFFGTSGTQSFDVTTSSTDCASGSSSPTTIPTYPAAPRCTQAEFNIALSAVAQPSQFLAGKNPATGTHSFAMAAQAVHGVRLQQIASYTPSGPVTVTPSLGLQSTLTAKVDSVVTLTFTVTNPASTPAAVVFNTGKMSDFIITDANNALLYRSSAGVSYTQMLSTTTIPAGGSVQYQAVWKPTVKGTLNAVALLTSQSHLASAKTTVTVP